MQQQNGQRFRGRPVIDDLVQWTRHIGAVAGLGALVLAAKEAHSRVAAGSRSCGCAPKSRSPAVVGTTRPGGGAGVGVRRHRRRLLVAYIHRADGGGRSAHRVDDRTVHQ